MNRFVNMMKSMSSQMMNDLNVLMIAEVQSYDSNKNTATVIPLHVVPEQKEAYQPIPNVFIGFFSIGGFSIKVQPSIGDKLLMLFCDYDIDNIATDGETKDARTTRTHNLQDAIIIPFSINFLNNAFNATQDLVIQKEGTSAYVKITNSGDIILNGNNIKLGANASTKVLLQGGTYGTPSSKVYAE